MRNKTKTILLPLLALVFAVMFCLSLAPLAARAADTDKFVLLTDTATNEGEPVGSNSVALTEKDGGFTVAGKQKDSRTVAVYDHGYQLGSKVSFTARVDQDYSGLNGGDLKSQVYFSLFFAQAEKGENGFDAADFKNSRTEGNGASLHLFSSEDLSPDTGGNYRGMVNISTFGRRDIVNTDSMYGNTHGEGVTDIGWAISQNKPFTIEMGTEKAGGIDQFYILITVDRTPERPAVSQSKISFPLTDLVKDTENQSPYYVAFEFANMNATERSVDAEVSAITAEEAGLTLEPESVFLKPEQTKQLSAKDAISSEAVADVAYVSENPEIASVSESGLVTALKAGTTKISATAADGRKGEAYVTVANKITLDADAKEMQVGEFSNLIATTNPANLSVVWSSSDDEVVSVNGGVLQALKAGTSTVTAKILNFESGELELKATCEVTVKAYEKPEDVHGDGTHYLYSENLIARGTGYEKTDKGISFNGNIQNGYTYAVIGEGVTFDKPVTFDIINKFDASNTTYANQFGRFLGISIKNGDANSMTAADFALGADSGLQVNLTTNAEWWNYGLKFMLPYQTGVSGTVEQKQTPENKGDLTGTDRYGNAFARAFCDGTRIQVKMWKDGDSFFVAFTPVFTEGEVPDGSENMTYPSGSPYDYVGPYTMQFDWAQVSKGINDGTWCIAVGEGNTIAANSAKAELSVENVNVGVLYGVEVSRSTQQMKQGTTFQLNGTTNPNSYIPTSAEWSSSDNSVATVDETGKVTAVKSGTATITYTVDGKSASCEVTVVGGLTVSEHEKSLKVGETYQITATVDPSSIKATFASGDDRIATVDENGKVTAVKEGTVKIYVRVGSLFSEEITVTVTAEGGASKGGCGSEIGFAAGAAALGLAAAGAAVVLAVKKRKNS